MSKECYDYSAIAGCFTATNGDRTSVVLHYYTDYNGQPAVRITDAVGNIVAGADETNTSPGACLIDVGEQQVELSDFTLGCALDGAGNAIGVVVLSRFVDEEIGVETQTRVMYPYDGSAPISPYSGPFGPCVPATLPTPHYIYLERNGGIVTMADIMATTGARQILSVTVKQISGVGVIQADSGSGVPMDAGETWSWSVVTEDHLEFLSTSALSMNAGGGEQRITATYIL